MDSWWQLGEWAGSPGSELSIYRITCPFCMEKGNFEVAFHAEKSKPNSRKTLNFDTLKCVNCAGYPGFTGCGTRLAAKPCLVGVGGRGHFWRVPT